MKALENLFYLLLLVAFFVGIHMAFIYAMPVVQNKMFVSGIEDVLGFETLRNESGLQYEIRKMAKSKNVQLGEKDLQILLLSDGSYKIKIDYKVEKDYFGYFPKTYEYSHEYEWRAP